MTQVLVVRWCHNPYFPGRYPLESWVVTAGLGPDLQGNTDDIQLYAWSIFKTLYTMIGGEDMVPSGYGLGCHDIRTSTWCIVESWIALFSLLIGVVFIAVLISTTSSILDNLDIAGRVYRAKFQEITECVLYPHTHLLYTVLLGCSCLGP